MTGLEILRRARAIVFDVGETLVDESRAWADLAESVGVSALTVGAVLGAVIDRGDEHDRVWDVLGVPSPTRVPRIRAADLYPDALACLRSVRRAGLVVGIAGNQPDGAVAELLAAGFEADFIGSSAAWGVAKPSPAFFAQVVQCTNVPAERIVYVGDRLDNDVLPARAAGLGTILIRRGPWGRLHARRPEAALAEARIDGLDEITDALADRDGSGRP